MSYAEKVELKFLILTTQNLFLSKELNGWDFLTSLRKGKSN